ncbi:MAG: KH domain-containing protein, partial [Acetobacteraceae bacterium]
MDTADPAQRLRDLLQRIAGTAGVEVSVEIEDGPDGLRAEYIGDDVALLIGRRGETIDAIQHLAYRIAMQGVAERRSV